MSPKVPINGADGKPLKSQEEQAKRWKEHFQTVLNCPDSINDLEIDTSAITKDEVAKVTKKLKNGKSVGVDGIQAELLKYGGDKLANRLTKLCNHIWEKGEVPRDWQDGIIIPFPKKGDLKDYNNWRGITLLSVPGKVLAE
jgi:hypothetical protein